MTRRGCTAWTRTGNDAVITHIRAAPPEEEVVVVAAEAGAAGEDAETRTPLHLRGASPALSVPRPHPRPLPLPSIFPSSRCPLPDMLFGFFACSSSAPCAKRHGPRTTLANAESTARMRRRMEKREEEREREWEEKRESGTCVTRHASTRSLRRGGGGEMVGMRKAHMMCVARLLLTPHPSPARRGKGIGGAEEVWGATGARDERRRVRVRNELKHQCNFPGLPLRLLILPSGRGSAPSSRRLLTAVGESIPPSTTCSSCDSDGARAAPASPRCGGEDAGYGQGNEDGDGDWAPTSDVRMHPIGRVPYPHEQLLQTFL